MTFPLQQSGSSHSRPAFHPGQFDIREQLDPRRLTIVMWDQAFLMRHLPGESYADYDRVLDETIERGYEWSVEDALEYGMWGWTPRNYCQPQFHNWKDVAWHRRLTERFQAGI
jgi:hypothetical protein